MKVIVLKKWMNFPEPGAKFTASYDVEYVLAPRAHEPYGVVTIRWKRNEDGSKKYLFGWALCNLEKDTFDINAGIRVAVARELVAEDILYWVLPRDVAKVIKPLAFKALKRGLG